MRSIRTLLPAAALLCGSWSSQALAAPPGPGAQPLQVLELATDDFDDQAKAFTLALRARVKASTDQSLLPGDFALGVLLAQLKCGDVPDPTCQLAIADKIKAERFIWGTMRKAPDGKMIVVDVHLWQRGHSEVRQSVTIAGDLKIAEDPNLQKIADQVLTKLVTFGKTGTIKLSSAKPINGDLFIDGQGQGKFAGTMAELTLPVGTHQIEVRADGKVVAQGTGRVAAEAPVEIELAVLASGDGGGQGPAQPTQASWKLPASYAAMGVGGVMVLAAGYMTVWAATDGFGDKSIKNFQPYAYKATTGTAPPNGTPGDTCAMAKAGESRHGITGASAPADVLKAAQDTCNRSDSFKTAQYVLYPLGALIAGGGAYLYMNSKKEGAATTTGSKRRIEVTPMVGANSGFLDMRVTF